nr:MFS-type transporter clz9-like [Parasteatoda tepidariorum]
MCIRFFNNLSNVYDRYEIKPQNVYNVNETCITTVQVPTKIVAKKGKKQVGAITSSERRTLVTCCVAVKATGNSIPPFLIFPRQKFHDHFIRDGPPGCIGAANGSGWMQAAEFWLLLHHFVKHAKPSKDNVVPSLPDNHDSHLYIPSIEFCQDNGIILLSLPTHCSHCLQPLDVSVYGPLKRYVNVAMNSWIKNHPGIRMTIYNIPEITRTTLPFALTPSNIASGLQKTGIWPFNRNIFQESDFAPSSVTDVPQSSLGGQSLDILVPDFTQTSPPQASLNEPALEIPPSFF